MEELPLSPVASTTVRSTPAVETATATTVAAEVVMVLAMTMAEDMEAEEDTPATTEMTIARDAVAVRSAMDVEVAAWTMV